MKPPLGPPSQNEPLDPSWALQRLITGHYISRALYVVAKLGIADSLKDGARSSADLAEATHSHAPSLLRLLRLLAGAGVFIETEAGVFALTAVGQALRSDAPGSQRAQALFLAGPYQQRAWSRLLDIVQTGDGPTSQTAFPFLARFPAEAAVFNEAMAERTAPVAAAFLDAYDCSHFSTVVELGGGFGQFLLAILNKNPAQRGILFDVPHVAEEARKHVLGADLAGRCEVVGGDFFEAVPPGGDAYILKSVIHDWDDNQSAKILTNIARAMAPGAKLLLVEMVQPRLPDESPWSGIIAGSDVNMLVNTGGRERSEDEFRRLFDSAGFELTRVIPTRIPWSIVEGVRAHGKS